MVCWPIKILIDSLIIGHIFLRLLQNLILRIYNLLLLLWLWLVEHLLRWLSNLSVVSWLLSKLRLWAFDWLLLRRVALGSDARVAVLAWRLTCLTSVCVVLWWVVSMARVVSTMTWAYFVFRTLRFFVMHITIRHDSVILSILVAWLLLLAVAYHAEGAVLHLVLVSIRILVEVVRNVDDALADQSASSFTLTMWRFIWKSLPILLVVQLFLVLFKNFLSYTWDLLVAELTDLLSMGGLVGGSHTSLGGFQRGTSTGSSYGAWVSCLQPLTSLCVWNIWMMIGVFCRENTLEICI